MSKNTVEQIGENVFRISHPLVRDWQTAHALQQLGTYYVANNPRQDGAVLITADGVTVDQINTALTPA